MALPDKVSLRTQQFIVKAHSRSQISTLVIEQKGALNLQLEFDAIKLPSGAYVEVVDEAGTRQVFGSAQELAAGLVVEGASATIRVYSDGLQRTSLRLKKLTYQPGPSPVQTRQILGADNRKDLACYANTPLYTPSLATATAIGNGSGSLIGNARYVLTNAHVTPALGANGEPQALNREVRLGWFNPTCNASAAQPKNRSIALRTTRQVLRGTPSSPTDYALLELDPFDVEHSHALEIFGSLQISTQNHLEPGTPIYVPQYGNGGLRPLVLSAENDAGLNTSISEINPDTFQIFHDADTQHGSSGAPLIEPFSQQIVGIHVGGTTIATRPSNRAVGLQVLQQQISPYLGLNNVAVLGEGKFSGYNLSLVPYLPPSAQVPLAAGSHLLTREDLPIEHRGRYSDVRIEVKNATTSALDTQALRLAIQDDSGIHDLSTAAGQNAQLLIEAPSSPSVYSPQNHRGWLPLQLNDEQGQRLQNLVVALNLANYNPFQSPFDGVNTQQLYLNIIDARSKASVSKLMDGKQYSYIATYTQQGPNEVEVKPTSEFAEVTVPLRSSEGTVQLIKLRGYRTTACNRRPMHASINCDSSLKRSTLYLEYWPQDNATIPPGTYNGLLPINAVAPNESHELLVNISLTQP